LRPIGTSVSEREAGAGAVMGGGRRLNADTSIAGVTVAAGLATMASGYV